MRLISAVTAPSTMSIRAQDAVGSPSKTYPALPPLTTTFQPKSRTSGTWVWPQQMTRASVRPRRSMKTFSSRPWSNPAVCDPGEAWVTRTSVSSSARIRRSAGRRRSQSTRSGPRASWAQAAAALNDSGTPSPSHGKAAP